MKRKRTRSPRLQRISTWINSWKGQTTFLIAWSAMIAFDLITNTTGWWTFIAMGFALYYAASLIATLKENATQRSNQPDHEPEDQDA